MGENGLLTRDAILSAADLRHERVEVPEWGGAVLVWTMTGEEKDAFEQAQFLAHGTDERVNLKHYRARLVVFTVRDEAGQRLFSPADITELARKAAIALDRIVPVAHRLNALTAATTEELRKNYAAEPGDGSTSA